MRLQTVTMSHEDGVERNVEVPVGKVIALSAAILPPLAVAAVGAATVLVLHFGRSKSLYKKYKEAKSNLQKLVAERDAVLVQLQEVQGTLQAHVREFTTATQLAQVLSSKYEDVLLDTEELQCRLSRSETFNRELQQTIKKERQERMAREKRIADLEQKIQEQKAIIKNLQAENKGDFTARSDDSAGVIYECNKLDLVTPPLPENERKSKSSWQMKLPRPPVPFRDVSFRAPLGAE